MQPMMASLVNMYTVANWNQKAYSGMNIHKTPDKRVDENLPMEIRIICKETQRHTYVKRHNGNQDHM